MGALDKYDASNIPADSRDPGDNPSHSYFWVRIVGQNLPVQMQLSSDSGC